MLKRGWEEEKGRRQRAERLSEGYSVVAENGTGTWMKGVTALREETKRSSPEKKEGRRRRRRSGGGGGGGSGTRLCARCRVSH